MRVDAKQLARAGYTYIGRLYSEMDCQAFVEQCLADCGMKINLPGSNAWYRRMDWTGTPEECKAQFGRIPVGAFLFILKARKIPQGRDRQCLPHRDLYRGADRRHPQQRDKGMRQRVAV